MKANELVKKYLTRERIDQKIRDANDDGCCAIYIPTRYSIADGVIESLAKDGFVVSIISFQGYFENAYKIEW